MAQSQSKNLSSNKYVKVHHYNDGSWEIVEILGKHKKDE
jgi:hypothetical protein